MSVEALPRHQPEQSLPESLPIERLIDHFPVMEEVLEGMEDRVFLLRADDNPAGTFKERGAGAKITELIEQGHTEMVIVSAGNHLRGGITQAAPLGVKVTGVVPITAPEEKKAGAKALWAARGGNPEDLTLIAVGRTYDDALRFATNHLGHAALVPAFDDLTVIKNQGGVMRDAVYSLPGLTHTVSATGGGGLIAGMTAYSAEHSLDVTPLAVEARGSDSLSQSLNTGGELPVAATNPNRRYGGLCVEKAGRHVLAVLRKHGFTTEGMTTAYDDDVLALASSYGESDRNYIEPSSLVAVAGLINFVNQGRFSDTDIVAVIATGHNENPSRLLQFSAKRQMRVASAQVLR
jgi:threonine dehydratase